MAKKEVTEEIEHLIYSGMIHQAAVGCDWSVSEEAIELLTSIGVDAESVIERANEYIEDESNDLFL